MDTLTPSLTDLGSGQWSIKVSRSLNATTQSGEVVVRADNESTAKQSPHIGLAAARAWLALGSQLIGQNDHDAATCLQTGLKELGKDYALPTDADDTDLKLAAATEQIDKGNWSDAVTVLQRILQSRVDMYTKTHAADIVR